MRIELNDTEVRELTQALSEHVDELMKELVHSDQRQYREELKRRYDSLEHLLAKLRDSPAAKS